MSKRKLTYETAYAELHEILEAIQGEEVSLDELGAKLKRAKELITFCKERLHAVEEELDDILEEETDED